MFEVASELHSRDSKPFPSLDQVANGEFLGISVTLAPSKDTVSTTAVGVLECWNANLYLGDIIKGLQRLILALSTV